MDNLPPLGVQEDMPILKKNRASTGVNDLDILLEGGYPNPANIMVLGPAGTEKTALAFHFAIAGLEKSEVAIFITTDATPQNIKEKAASIGLDIPEGLIFVDCYSKTLGSSQQDEKSVVYLPGPSALEEFSVSLKEIIDRNVGKKMRVIFNTFSTFLLYNPKDSMLKFLQIVGGRLKNAGATTLFIVEEGVHDRQLISTVERSMDDKLVILDKGGSFELEMTSAGISVPIRLGPNGITII